MSGMFAWKYVWHVCAERQEKIALKVAVSHETIVYRSRFLYLSTQGRAEKPFYLSLQISFIVFCLSRKKTGKLQTQIIMFHCSCRCNENSGHVNFRSSGGKRYTFLSLYDETNMLEFWFQQKNFLTHFS